MIDGCCEEKLRLLFEFQSATGSYSASVAAMAKIVGGLLPKVDFDLLSKAANSAYEKCVKARDCFYNHMREHGC